MNSYENIKEIFSKISPESIQEVIDTVSEITEDIKTILVRKFPITYFEVTSQISPAGLSVFIEFINGPLKLSVENSINYEMSTTLPFVSTIEETGEDIYYMLPLEIFVIRYYDWNAIESAAKKFEDDHNVDTSYTLELIRNFNKRYKKYLYKEKYSPNISGNKTISKKDRKIDNVLLSEIIFKSLERTDLRSEIIYDS